MFGFMLGFSLIFDCIAPTIEKEKCSSKSEETSSSMIMYSKRILFTYQSPYLNSSVDITEYDKVFVIIDHEY